MQKLKSIPVIDLFAGPGGLGEGFSSLYIKNQRAFNIRLSIEKDKIAHETLELRSFYRQFPKDNIPAEYYELLRESNLQKRNKLREANYGISLDKWYGNTSPDMKGKYHADASPWTFCYNPFQNLTEINKELKY